MIRFTRGVDIGQRLLSHCEIKYVWNKIQYFSSTKYPVVLPYTTCIILTRIVKSYIKSLLWWYLIYHHSMEPLHGMSLPWLNHLIRLCPSLSGDDGGSFQYLYLIQLESLSGWYPTDISDKVFESYMHWIFKYFNVINNKDLYRIVTWWRHHLIFKANFYRMRCVYCYTYVLTCV